MNGIMEYTALELAELVRLKKIKIEDVVNVTIDNIEKYDREINAFITVDRRRALERAKELQEKLDAGEDIGILGGVPIAIKDNICVDGVKNTCASKILENFVPCYSATAVDNIEKAGAIIIGKTNMDEFGMGSTTKTSYYGVTKNPIDNRYIPGGSSGGSCAAVSGNMCSIALGSDTGGSIRQPAAFCGLVGMKPTYGTVSRYGLVAYASSLEQIGPIAKNVADCATLLEVISGYDSKDSTSVQRKDYDFTSGLVNDVKGMKIAVPKEYFTDDLQPQIKEAIENTLELLKEKGAEISEINLDYTEHAVMAYYVIACAEASSNLARYDGVKFGYRAKEYNDLHEMYENTKTQALGEEVRRRIALGEYVLSSGFYEEHYLKALKVRRLIKEQFEECFKEYDAIIAPVTKTNAIKADEDMDNIKMYMDDLYTVPANLCGLPALSMKIKDDENGLPIGIQIIGGCFREKDVIRVAYTLEQIKR